MKKVLGFLFIILILSIHVVWADDKPLVNISVDGELKKGQDVTISLNIENVENLYSLSMDYVYNTDIIKVKSIEPGNLIKGKKFEELRNEPEKDGDTASYKMTFKGMVEGISGSGSIVKIKGKVLGDVPLEINDTNLTIKLVGIDSGNNVYNMPFDFERSIKNEDNGNDKKEGIFLDSDENLTYDTTKVKSNFIDRLLGFLHLDKKNNKSEKSNIIRKDGDTSNDTSNESSNDNFIDKQMNGKVKDIAILSSIIAIGAITGFIFKNKK